jgi:hypothetical protein
MKERTFGNLLQVKVDQVSLTELGAPWGGKVPLCSHYIALRARVSYWTLIYLLLFISRI